MLLRALLPELPRDVRARAAVRMTVAMTRSPTPSARLGLDVEAVA